MKIIKEEKKLCLLCMENHTVQTVVVNEAVDFKGEKVDFAAHYEYCNISNELLETEEFIRLNNLAMKDKYREIKGLLTSHEIIAIRKKYKVSQKDFSKILDWGEATITRYENHQVQERAYDDILRKIDMDPRWFLDLLERTKENLSQKAYKKYKDAAKKEYFQRKNDYLISSIEACYAGNFSDEARGRAELNLKKISEIISYFASKVESLHKVKLMKLLWYADNLSFKRHGYSITGLIYHSYPMGALPLGHEQIIELEDVSYQDVIYNNFPAYKFKAREDFRIEKLDKNDLEILDRVIERLGEETGRELSQIMHGEEAYEETEAYSVLTFNQERKLSIE